MTQLGTETELFKKFKTFRDRIVLAESIAELSAIKAEIAPYIKLPPPDGLKLDLRKILDNCIKNQEAELYGDPKPETSLSTSDLVKEMDKTTKAKAKEVPDEVPLPATGAVEVDLSTITTTDAVEVDLSTITATGAIAKAKEKTAELSTIYSQIDNENFGPETPAPVAKIESVVTPTKRSTKKELVQHTPQPTSFKVFRRINIPINGVAYSNNEFITGVVGSDQESVLAKVIEMEDFMIEDVKRINTMFGPPRANTPTTSAPTPAPTKTPDTITVKDTMDVFGNNDYTKEVATAIEAKDPSGLTSAIAKDMYNLDRLRTFIATVRTIDTIQVTLDDGSGMLLGAYITEMMKTYAGKFPVAK